MEVKNEKVNSNTILYRPHPKPENWEEMKKEWERETLEMFEIEKQKKRKRAFIQGIIILLIYLLLTKVIFK